MIQCVGVTKDIRIDCYKGRLNPGMEFYYVLMAFMGCLREEEIYQVEASKEQIKEWVQKCFQRSKKKRRIRQSVLCDRQSSEQEIGKIYHQRYQVRKILGEGGMGKSFSCTGSKDRKRGCCEDREGSKTVGQGEGDLAKIKTYQRCAGIIFAGKEKELFW